MYVYYPYIHVLICVCIYKLYLEYFVRIPVGGFFCHTCSRGPFTTDFSQRGNRSSGFQHMEDKPTKCHDVLLTRRMERIKHTIF